MANLPIKKIVTSNCCSPVIMYTEKHEALSCGDGLFIEPSSLFMKLHNERICDRKHLVLMNPKTKR
jgi:hypothetical protein